MIPQKKLSALANWLARAGGRRIPESVLERDYCLAWFLVSLSRTPLRRRMAFKGGTALKRCYIPDYRFSEDLDFTLTENAPFGTIRRELDLVFQEARRAAGINFSFLRYEEQQNTHTFYVGYMGPLPTTIPKEVKVDATIRELVIFPPHER